LEDIVIRCDNNEKSEFHGIVLQNKFKLNEKMNSSLIIMGDSDFNYLNLLLFNDNSMSRKDFTVSRSSRGSKPKNTAGIPSSKLESNISYKMATIEKYSE